MSWNAGLIETIFNTFAVCFGSSLLAVFIGLSMALLTVCFRVPGHRLLGACLLGLVFVPVYVQATAWSAGFGLQGWFRLSQVSAAISPWQAIGSVIWIQGSACSPISYLLCCAGVARAMDSSSRQALMDFGVWNAVTRRIVPIMRPWIIASFLIGVAMTGNDMIVTNLYQVPTLTESLYQQVQFNELRTDSIVTSCVLVLVLAASAWMVVVLWYPRLSSELTGEGQSSFASAYELTGASRWAGTVFAIAIVSVVVLVPLTNLVVKAGWLSRIDIEVIRRGWSFGRFAESLLEITAFRQELFWSCQLSVYATILAFLLACSLLFIVRSRWGNALCIGLACVLLAMPGPLVNLVSIRLSNLSNASWFVFLVDRTLALPVLALQCRCLPIAFGILWIAEHRFRKRNESLLKLDLELEFRVRVWVRMRALVKPLVIGLSVCFFVAFADLSTYLLVQPPGVTTVSMRMFDLLHYGVKNQDASLALVLAACGMLAAWCVARFYRGR